jgi:hypothetical protein
MIHEYLILVKDLPTSLKSFYLDGVVLKGNKDELMKKMSSLDYVKSVGIPESLYFEKFELVKKSDVDFPLNM